MLTIYLQGKILAMILRMFFSAALIEHGANKSKDFPDVKLSDEYSYFRPLRRNIKIEIGR